MFSPFKTYDNIWAVFEKISLDQRVSRLMPTWVFSDGIVWILTATEQYWIFPQRNTKTEMNFDQKI